MARLLLIYRLDQSINNKKYQINILNQSKLQTNKYVFSMKNYSISVKKY